MATSELSSPATLDVLDAADQTAASSYHESSMDDSNVVVVADHVVKDISSNSTSTLEDAAADPAATSTSVPPSNNDSWSGRQAAKRQRLERKGHTKSRRGCFNCKKRRIKVMNSPGDAISRVRSC